jgi:hypothetical protein
MPVKLILTSLIAALAFGACSVQKRHYRRGFYIDAISKKHASLPGHLVKPVTLDKHPPGLKAGDSTPGSVYHEQPASGILSSTKGIACSGCSLEASNQKRLNRSTSSPQRPSAKISFSKVFPILTAVESQPRLKTGLYSSGIKKSLTRGNLSPALSFVAGLIIGFVLLPLWIIVALFGAVNALYGIAIILLLHWIIQIARGNGLNFLVELLGIILAVAIWLAVFIVVYSI